MSKVNDNQTKLEYTWTGRCPRFVAQILQLFRV